MLLRFTGAFVQKRNIQSPPRGLCAGTFLSDHAGFYLNYEKHDRKNFGENVEAPLQKSDAKSVLKFLQNECKKNIKNVLFL